MWVGLICTVLEQGIVVIVFKRNVSFTEYINLHDWKRNVSTIMPRRVAVSRVGGGGKYRRASRLLFNGSSYSTSGGVL